MTGVVKFSLVGLTVKRELGLGPSVADLELEASSSRSRSKGVSKCSRTVGRIRSVEAKRKEGSGVE